MADDDKPDPSTTVTCAACGAVVELAETARLGAIPDSPLGLSLGRRSVIKQCNECGCGSWLHVVEDTLLCAGPGGRGSEITAVWRVDFVAEDVFESEAAAVSAWPSAPWRRVEGDAARAT